ncbi:MAG TPA: ribonuclease domain-containing protein, partial [Thermodesulfobacteriota bacterium]|nr:ribonuclease domain-containing protein [Thermodesulfobacteriota bacterium]
SFFVFDFRVYSILNMTFCKILFIFILAAWGVLPLARGAFPASCETVVGELNAALNPRIDEKELVSVLESLNRSGNKALPPKFVTKSRARNLGWKPGRPLWENKQLEGKSLGGDFFGNREGRLPNGKRVWREADLDYRGGRRGPKRLLYSNDGLRAVTVDHYQTFKEVPPCE